MTINQNDKLIIREIAREVGKELLDAFRDDEKKTLELHQSNCPAAKTASVATIILGFLAVSGIIGTILSHFFR